MTMTDKEFEQVVRDTTRSLGYMGRRWSVMDWYIPLFLGFLMGIGAGIAVG